MTSYEYKLKFTDKQEADSVLNPIRASQPSWAVFVHTIGIHRECIDVDEEGACTEWLELEGWHVDVKSTVELAFSEQHLVVPKNPIHAFSELTLNEDKTTPKTKHPE